MSAQLDAAVRLARLRRRMFAQLDRPRIAQYHVLRPIGEGGNGLVFAAWDPSLDRVIAIKVLRDACSPRGGARLRREAVALARLRHPNVVSVFEVGDHDGQVYLAMEYVEGQTLRSWMRAWRERTRDLRSLVDVFLQAARGLVAAHSAGLVHGDVKPENVMIDGDARVRLMDFGLARPDLAGAVTTQAAAGCTAGVEASTEHNRGDSRAWSGTPGYMAPEQFHGVAPGPAADQFALCACLFEAVYGRRARPDRVEQAAAVADTPVDVPAERGVPRRLQAILRRGLAVDPGQRWPSMAALVDELTGLRRSSVARPVALGGVAVAITGVLAGAALATPEDNRCKASLAGVWDGERRAALAAVFERHGAASDEGARPRVEAALERYAAAWVEISESSCRATFVHHQQSEALFDRRMSCLERRKNRLGGAVEALLAADSVHALIERTMAPFTLPSLAACEDLEAVASEPMPADPQERSRIVELRGELDRLATMFDVGEYDTALPLAASIIASARELEHLPVLAEALVWRGRLQNQTASPRDAEATLREALVVAAQGGDTRSEAVAWTELLMSHAMQGTTEQGVALEIAARVAVERADDEVVRGWLLNNAGALWAQHGQPDQGRELLRQAIEIKESALGPDHVDVGISWYNLGHSFEQSGAFDEAREALEHARTIFGATVGPAHPMFHVASSGLCAVEREQGHAEAAVALCSEALAQMETSQQASRWTSTLGLALARAEWAAGRPEQARQTAERARRVVAGVDPQTVEDIEMWLADPQGTEREWARAAAR